MVFSASQGGTCLISEDSFCHNDLGMSGHHATVLVVLSDYHLEKPYILHGHFITNLSGGQVLTMGVSVLS